MPVIIGLCGLSGVGKSTVRKYLSERAATEGLYLGAIVLDEVKRRGLPETRESESIVRLDLRENNRAELLVRGLPLIERAIKSGRSAVVDAILLPEEYEALRAAMSGTPIHLLKIHASVEKRLVRLASRASRPLNAGEIAARDNLELHNLRTDRVFDVATHVIYNEDTLDDLSIRARDYAESIGCGL